MKLVITFAEITYSIMKTKSIFLALIAILAFSCKDDKADTGKSETPNEVVKNVFKVSVTMVAKKDDKFSLFYTEDGTTDFKQDPIWMDIKGGDQEQTLNCTLPPDVFPTEFRLDFGMNKEQESVVLKSVTFEYNGKQRVIAGAELGNFFRPDDSKCTFDPATGVIKGIEKNGMKTPSLYPHEVNLKAELEKLAK